jgi:hypothetical protein
MKEIITYDVFIEDEGELGVDKLSLVKKPAIMTDFIWMNEENIPYQQIKLSDEKRIITGPALIPDIEIIRKDDDDEPYYIKYSAEQIESIVQKFFKEKDQFSVNKNHKTDVSGVWMYESWIVGDNDKSKDLGFDLPKGTWMVSMKIDDDEIWEGIKSGKYKGFSIEGLFKFKRTSKYVKQRKLLRRNLDSANVDRILFNDETLELAIQFKEGDVYIYPNQSKEMFDSLVRGEGICRTEGENQWGSWFVGKTPSIGAAVYSKLVETEAEFRLGTTADVQLEELQLQDKRVERFLSKYSDNELVMMADLLERLRRIVKLSEENLEKDIKNKNINMVSAITKSGTTLYADAESMAVGVEVYTLNGEEKVKVDAGEYEMKDGSVVVIDESSVIAEIKEGEVASEESAENVDAGMGYKKDKDKNEEQEVDGYDARAEFEAVKGMLENISMKLDALIGEKMAAVEQSITELKEKQAETEIKVEKLSVEGEMKSVETIDDVKKVVQEAQNKKRVLDYNIITQLNKKF